MSAPATSAPPPPKTGTEANGHRRIRILKVVVNAGVGQSGDPLTKATKVLEMITRQKPVATHSRTTNRDFGIRAGQIIGAKVTLRGDAAKEFLDRAFDARDRQFDPDSIDKWGNFSLGIADYTDFTGMKYDPEIGIHGMDISVEVGRGGYRVRERRIAARAIPKRLRSSREETRQFLADNFHLTFVE
jgi:large subunit ribosomal protein L5